MKFTFTTQREKRITAIIVATATVWGLVACGNSNDGGTSAVVDPPPAAAPPSIPASAGASVPAFVAYASTLPLNETQEPLLADVVTAPTTETEEPISV